MALGAHASRRKADVKKPNSNPFPYARMGVIIALAFIFLYSSVDLMYNHTWQWVIFNVVVILSSIGGLLWNYQKVMEWARRQDVIEAQRKKDNPLDNMKRWN